MSSPSKPTTTKPTKSAKFAKLASTIASKPLPKPSSRPPRLISTRSISGPVQSSTAIKTQAPATVLSPPLTPTLLSPSDGPPPLPERSSSRLSTASCSTTSTNSSGRSSMSKGDLQARRRGFMRPQTTEFSNSARARDSVMSLGSIAHLQYFFAKTGLLDGKGGRGLKKKASGDLEDGECLSPTGSGPGEYLSIDYLSPPLPGTLSRSVTPEPLSPGLDRGFMSDSNLDDYPSDEDEEFMHIPPTQSTYKAKKMDVPPPPDPEVLRGRLREALALTKRTWELTPLRGENLEPQVAATRQRRNTLGGVDVVELATSAVRAAKAYYYTTDITRVGAKSEKALREDFISILEALKRMGQVREVFNDRKVTAEEKAQVIGWCTSVEDTLSQEESSIGEIRRKCREWSEGDWTGREMERNHAFLSFFDPSPTPLPAPPKDETYPNDFLKELQSGLRLILIHNSIVKSSKRPFGRIPRYHTEFSKPYRMAENLRFWRKEADIRWEVKIGEWGDVFEVVNGTEQGWRGLEKDINTWCETILAEAKREWGEEKV